MLPTLQEAVQTIAVWALPLILAITLHEAAHGFAAEKFGDDTAKRMGRLSLNPVRHIDPVGTILLPALMLATTRGMLFGWAKPVPVNFGRLKPQRWGMIGVAMAGPGTNIVLALISAIALYVVPHLPGLFHDWTLENLENSLEINIVLAIFNMLPIPPLDGSRVILAMLPHNLAVKFMSIERYSMMGLFLAMFLLPMVNIPIFTWVVGIPAGWMELTILNLTGTARFVGLG